MTKDISLGLMMATASLVLAACSSASSQEAVATTGANAAIVTQSGGGPVASLDAAPPAPAPRVIAPEPLAPPVVARANFTCDIDVIRTPNGIRITPVVRTDRTLNGEYSLVITRTGSSGSSDISQGGPFDAASGERVKLGASEISFARGDKYRAVLKVRADGREICRDTRP